MFGSDDKVSEIRLTATQYLILAIFLVLAWGLWSLQVMKSDYYSLAAEKNRIRNVPVLAPRRDPPRARSPWPASDRRRA